MEVRDIDRFCACGRCGEEQNCNQQKLPSSHHSLLRSAGLLIQSVAQSWLAQSSGIDRRKSIQVAAHEDQVTIAHLDRGGRARLIGKLFASCARKITSQSSRPLPERGAFAGLKLPPAPNVPHCRSLAYGPRRHQAGAWAGRDRPDVASWGGRMQGMCDYLRALE